ncbi:MAG: LuxR C-terminal-related transcriptional regulator [Deltaproteobacteria bacterium]
MAHLIKNGKSSRGIADLMNVSRGAIDVYRYRIRTRLQLNNKKANLRSYLTSLT